MLLIDKYINHLYTLASKPLAEEDIKACKLRIIDYLGVTLAGGYQLAQRVKQTSTNDLFYNPTGKVPLIGQNNFANYESAVLLNALASHTVELDDGDRIGMVHPGSPVISALISALFKYKLDSQNFIKGILLGYEATILLARILQPHLKNNGYHATGVCGNIGAAIGIATALNFSKLQLKTVLLAATTSAAGLLQVFKGKSELKPYNAAQAAASGFNAINMGLLGLTGSSDIFSGKHGFIYAITGLNIDEFETPQKPLIHDAYIKPYASCRHCHAPLEASMIIKIHNKINIKEIKKIEVKTHKLAIYLHDHKEIFSAYDAKMSIPYCVAASLVLDTGGMEAFNELALANNQIQELTQKIVVIEEPEFTKQVPSKRPAEVKIIIKGTHYTHRVDFPLGEPENPISETKFLDKFFDLAKYAQVSQLKAQEMVDAILNQNKLVLY